METQTSNTKCERKFHNTIKWRILKKTLPFTNCNVTRKGVAEQGFYSCAFCVNARFTDKGSRINPAVTFINEGGGFYHFGR